MNPVFRTSLWMTFAVFAVCSVSCGPLRQAVNVEMRHPSKSGLELAGKSIAVVSLEGCQKAEDEAAMAFVDGFASAIEQDYGTGEGSVGVYRMSCRKGADYSSKDTLVNILMDTGADVVFLVDTLRLGTMGVGEMARVAAPSSADSSYLSTGHIIFGLKMYCYDSLDKRDKVFRFTGDNMFRPAVYSDGRETQETLIVRAYAALPQEASSLGKRVSDSFVSTWKHEQYSILGYDSVPWITALEKAEDLDWKGAMDIWLERLDTKDMQKRACAGYNIAVACYMLGDYKLASEWLDRSDADCKLPVSDALRKRIEARR